MHHTKTICLVSVKLKMCEGLHFVSYSCCYYLSEWAPRRWWRDQSKQDHTTVFLPLHALSWLSSAHKRCLLPFQVSAPCHADMNFSLYLFIC